MTKQKDHNDIEKGLQGTAKKMQDKKHNVNDVELGVIKTSEEDEDETPEDNRRAINFREFLDLNEEIASTSNVDLTT